jgi:hypothetical protein
MDKLNESSDVQKAEKTTTNYRRILDSDSSDDEITDTVATENDVNKSFVNNSLNSNKSSSCSESERENVEQPKKNRRKGIPQKKVIIKNKASKNNSKPQRVSAKRALETIKDELNVQAEKSTEEEKRKPINVPYHKPKQYSLKEFLARKNINKPSVEKIKEQKAQNTILAMKMTCEQLEQFAQKIKQREEEALEFFKAQSESDDTDEEKDDKMIKDPSLENHIELCAENQEPVNKNNDVFENDEETKKDDTSLNIVESTSQEVIDDKEIEAIEECVVEKNSIVSLKNIPYLKTLTEMQSDNLIIDLETGKIQPKKLTGPELLFQKYLKTQAKPKLKDTVTMNILSVENGKLENQSVEVKLDKKVELDHNRPGFSHEKLKESLLNKITNRRLQELKNKMVKTEQIEFEPEEKCTDTEMETDDKGFYLSQLTLINLLNV